MTMAVVVVSGSMDRTEFNKLHLFFITTVGKDKCAH